MGRYGRGEGWLGLREASMNWSGGAEERKTS